MLSHQQKLDFVLKMTKHALSSVQHFDAGGTVLSGPVVAGTQNSVNPANQGAVGAVGSALGTNNTFQAAGAPITPGTNTAQLNAAYTGAQGALGQAGELTNTLTPGVRQGAQSQNTLTNELTAESLGGGPNPAQAALNLNTGQNISQAAALAASTRGAGVNAGLVAQNAANTGAQTQQTAVGQEALNQQQQQLNAQNQLAGVAATQVGQGTNAVQLNNQTQQNEQNILQGANTAENNANVSMQQNINNTNAAVAAGNQNANLNILGGIGQGLSSIGSAGGLFAEGGVVPKHIKSVMEIYHPHLAEGGMAFQPSTPPTSTISAGAPVSLPAFSQIQFVKSPDQKKPPSEPMQDPYALVPGGAGAVAVPQLATPELSPYSGGTSLGVEEGVPGSSNALTLGAQRLAKGGKVMKDGGKVPGKPKVDHNAYKNDTVAAKLSPGEVVIPIDTLKDKGKLGQMARFVAANIERKKMGRAV